MRHLECSENNLTSLDTSNNPELTAVACTENSLTSLDLSRNTMLESLKCDGNKLTVLDLRNNPKLETLGCRDNYLTSLDISNNPDLQTIYCEQNPYSVILESGNTVDLTQLPGDFDVARSSKWSGGVIDGTALSIDFTGSCSAYVTYSYDIGGTHYAEFALAIERIHIPGGKISADYTECGGGWLIDCYRCTVCHAFCDEKGEALSRDDVYKEGTGHHTANLNQKCEANYSECSGGWIVDYYLCKDCNNSCLIDGSKLDWQKYYKEGTGKHTPDTTQKIEPDYTECGGGWIITRYPCKNCNCDCLIDGTEPDYKTYHKGGNGLHTANLSQKHGPNYTECGGGWTVEYYNCEKCNRSCLLDGTELDHNKHYKEGTGKHTPGFEKEPTYTACGGGFTTPYHECVVCGEMCDAGGNELDWSEVFQSGNGKHTPGKVFEPNFTECGTGYKIPYSVCTVCGYECRVDGSEVDYSTDFEIGNGKHTPGIIYKWNYRRCGVGSEDAMEYSICVVCGDRCNPDGSYMGWGEGGMGTHVDADGDGVCDKGGELIYPVVGGNIYVDPETGYIRDCDGTVTEADIPSSIKGVNVMGIMRYAFAYDLPPKLQKLTLPEGLQIIEAQAFASRYDLQSLTIPNSVVSIGESAFEKCASIPKLIIPDSVKNIENMAFAWCEELGNVTIGNGIERIGHNTFLNCHKLNTITFEGNAPAIENTAFKGVTATVYYPGNDSTWTDAVRQNYGGTLTWVAYNTTNENTLVLDESQFGNASILWIDGVQYVIKDSDRVDGKIYLDLPDTEQKILTTHTYNTGSSNLHQVYPTGMKVWKLSNDGTSYTAAELKEFSNILQYCGSSIRMTGVKGIRMITGVPDGQRNALLNGNLAGYTLEEYGTVIGFASEAGDNLTLENGRSNYAYKRGVSDAIFAQSGGKTQYTNVLVGFTMEQCKEDIAMRPYMKVKDSEGNVSVIYGGIVYRSIGYIAWQNRDVYPQGSDGCNYIWDIINAVYGDNQPG